MEIWDAYDREFHKIEGKTLLRGETVPEGMYHLVCEVALRHQNGDFLLMQRDPRKHRGGLWECTAGGSALAGESPEECALRELWEETGIRGKELSELGRTVSDEYRTIYVLYLAVAEGDRSAVTLQEGETVAFRWVKEAELFAMETGAFAAVRTLECLRARAEIS